MLLKSFLFAAAFSCSSALWALDLTPIVASRQLEGFEVPIILFKDGARKVAYQPPGHWRLSSSGAGMLQLFPQDGSRAVMQIRLVSKEASAEEELPAWAQALLPAGTSDVALSGQCESPFTLGGLSSKEFTFSYIASGRRCTASVAVVELDERQRLAVIVSAGAGEFKAVHGEAIASLFSWNWRE